ncbi:MAG: hypothetical protein JW881_03995 [Spirochaetales bacterium]|nr:hypothetical protein [Spirochaetales bacterium]
MKHPEAFIKNRLIKAFVNHAGFDAARFILQRVIVSMIIPAAMMKKLALTIDSYFKSYIPRMGKGVAGYLYHFKRKLAEDIIAVNLSFENTVNLIEKKVTIRGKENIDSALSSKKGIILLGAHFGSIILGTMSMLKACFDSASFPRPRASFPRPRASFSGRSIHMCTEPDMIRFPENLKRLKEAVRVYNTALYFILTDKKGHDIAHDMINALDRGNIISTNMDVLRGGSDTYQFTLFGKARVTLPALMGAVKVACMTEAAILPWYMVRDGGGFVLTCEAPVFAGETGDRGSSRPQSGAHAAVAEKLRGLLEQWIIRNPEQWVYWDRFGKRLVR